MGMLLSSRAFRTPMWTSALAPPHPSASPILGVRLVEWLYSVECMVGEWMLEIKMKIAFICCLYIMIRQNKRGEVLIGVICGSDVGYFF